LRRDRFVTLTSDAEIRIEVKKSVFIAEAGPIRSANEAQRRIDSVRRRYPDATHHVYAWRISRDEILQKYSDDKEPSGTAGMPVLDILRRNGIEDAIIIVTRYFGGVRLGTGGLARAYSKAAGEAVKEAKPCLFAPAIEFEIPVDFTALDRLRHVLEKEGFTVGSVLYGDTPVLKLSCPEEEVIRMIRLCLDNSSGRAEPVRIGETEIILEKVGDLTIDGSN